MRTNNNGDVYEWEAPRPKVKIPAGAIDLWDWVKPSTYHYSYSNPESQNALAKATAGFPDFIRRNDYDVHSAYSDRLCSWDAKRFDEVCKLLGGDQVWAYKAQAMNDSELKEVAKIAFDLKELPDHVRIIHTYNVSNGYSCPVIEALCKKGKL